MKIVNRRLRNLPRIVSISLFITCYIQVLTIKASDNIDWISTWGPETFFRELLDCEYRNDTLYAAGVGGFMMVDITDPADPESLGRYPYQRIYHVAVWNEVAYGFNRYGGILIIDFGGSGDPYLQDLYQLEGVSFEDGQIVGNELYAAAHEQGLFIFRISDDGGLTLIGQSSDDSQNATALAVRDGLAYVADGAGGVLVLDITDPEEPIFVSQINTTSAAQDIDFRQNYAVVAVGGHGIDIIDFTDPMDPVFMSNLPGQGSAFNLSVENNLAYVARWERIEVIDVSDPQNPILAGWEDTPHRAMGLTVHDSVIFVADWAFIETYRFGESIQADIHIDFSRIDMGDAEVGETIDTIFTVYNTGGSALVITDIDLEDDSFSVFPDNGTIPADSSFEFQLAFTAPDDDYKTSMINMYSNDPDEPVKRFRASANGTPRLHIGDPAPDFTLMGIDGQQYTLSEYYGRVVLLAFFGTW